MASSSNRHWPSMFKSKPHHQWHRDISNTSQRTTPYSSGDERNPEPKPRWNPKPEQIRILESIFNSGMVNPPRDEIRKIRVQLQEYGQVGDANVFYWFQNRKSRSKNKLRHLQNSKNHQNQSQEAQKKNNSCGSSLRPTVPSSSSSSEKDLTNSNKVVVINNNNNSPTASVNQAYFQGQNGNNNLLVPPALTSDNFYFPLHHQNGEVQVQGVVDNNAQGIFFSDFSNLGGCTNNNTNMWVNEIMSFQKKDDDEENKGIMNQQPQLMNFCVSSSASSPTLLLPPFTTAPVTVPSTIPQLQGVGEEAAGRAKCTVLINDVAFEVAVGPFNVREAFGNVAVLLDSSGHPVLTDEWGVTLHSLQHGASYYLI